MFTRCSYCQVAYEVTPEALAQGRGCLHCVACRHDFDALEWLTRELPEGEHAFKARPPVAASVPNAGDSARPSRWLEVAFPGIVQNVPPPEAPASPLSEALSVHSDLIEPTQAPTPPEPARPAHGFMPGAAMVSAFEAEARLALEAIPDPQPSATRQPDPEPSVPAQATPQATAAVTPSAFDFDSHPAIGSHAPLPTAPEHGCATGLDGDAHPDCDAFDAEARDRLDLDAEIDAGIEKQADAEASFHPILDTPPVAAGPAPAFIPEPQGRSRRSALRPWLVIVLLSLLLGFQSLHAERERLAVSASWRPWVERLCHLTGCELPPWHDPAALRLMARDVRPHPSVPGALLISASFRNEAPWAQPWPDLDLALADLDGHAIAQRRFSPREYLGIGAQNELIQAGQTASVVLEVRDPGKQAVAFEFEFH